LANQWEAQVQQQHLRISELEALLNQPISNNETEKVR
jgi:hypothetical protein